MFHLITLPFRLLFGIIFGLLALPFALLALPLALLFLPFLLLRFVVKTTVFLILLPIVLLVGAIVLVATLFAVSLAVLVPLLPFAFVALCVWAIVRLASRPALGL
jgi:hypothetical protein